MNPEHEPRAVPSLGPDFAQRVLRHAKQQRRRDSTLRLVFGVGASLAVVILLVRPSHRVIPKTPAAIAVAIGDLGEVEMSDAVDSDEGDPGSYFFPDAQADSELAAEAQAVADDDLSEATAALEGSEE